MEKIEVELQLYLNFKDVTELFHEVCEGLSFGDMITSENYNIFDCMASSELFDPKMDLKAGYKDIVHPMQQIQKKVIKRANDLSNIEIISVLDAILAYEFIWLRGYSLSHTLYKFVYFYDEATYKDSQILKAYIEGVYLSGSIIYDILRNSSQQDGYIITLFAFPKTQTESIITNAISLAEKSIEHHITSINSRKKMNISMNEYDAIHVRLKYRKAFLKLVQLMKNSNLSPTIEKQFQEQINSCKKRLEEIQQTHELYIKDSKIDISHYFQNNLNKTINCLITPSTDVDTTFEEGFEMAQSFFNSLQYIISLSKETDFVTILERIREFNTFPKNILAKKYLDVNIFSTPEKYFSLLPLQQMLKNTFKNYGLKECNFASCDYKEYSKQGCNVIKDYIELQLRHPCRQYLDFSKLYKNVCTLLNLSDKYGKDNFQNKYEVQIASRWCQNLSCRLIIAQLHLGFQLQLYDQIDHSYIFFALEFVYDILQINHQAYLLKVDLEILKDLQIKQKNGQSKKKKKLKPFQKRILQQLIYYKAMYNYCKASACLCYLMEKLNLNQEFNTEETQRNKYTNRFKIFENVYFFKFLSYEQFLQKISEICPDITNMESLSHGLNEIKEMFTLAQLSFQKIVQDDEFATEIMRDEAKKLVRICVISSMTALKIKMKIGKLANFKALYKNQELAQYPTLEIVL